MGLRLLVVDDHAIVRAGLRAIVGERPDVTEVLEAADGEAAVRIAHCTPVDIIIMDIRMPRMNGVDAARQILAMNATVKPRIIGISAKPEMSVVAGAMKAGMVGFISKEAELSDVSEAIDAALEGTTYVSPRLAGRVVGQLVDSTQRGEPTAWSLTDRERQVLRHLADGNTSKEIAVVLQISRKTVETHRYQIMGKLQVHSVAELTKLAIREGITALS